MYCTVYSTVLYCSSVCSYNPWRCRNAAEKHEDVFLVLGKCSIFYIAPAILCVQYRTLVWCVIVLHSCVLSYHLLLHRRKHPPSALCMPKHQRPQGCAPLLPSECSFSPSCWCRWWSPHPGYPYPPRRAGRQQRKKKKLVQSD